MIGEFKKLKHIDISELPYLVMVEWFEEVNHRITEVKKACGALKTWKKRHIPREAKVGMYEGIIEPSLLHGCEVWTLKKCGRKRMEAFEMNCLRNICSLRRI